MFTITGGVTITGGIGSGGTTPGAPTNIVATKINDTTVRLNITPPVDTGGLPIFSYSAVSSPGGFTGTSTTNIVDVVGNYIGGSGPNEYQFNGSSFYEIPYNAAFQFSNNAWTIEAFITPTTSNTVRGIVNNWNIGGAFGLEITSSNVLRFSYTATSSGISTYEYFSNTTIQTNVRTHIAVVKQGLIIQFYINGVKDTNTHNMPSGLGGYIYYYNGVPKALRYGIGNDNGSYFTGRISNLRIVYGNAIYQNNFTVPSLPLTVTQSASTNISAIDGTSLNRTLLLVMTDTNLGKDYSTNNWTSTLTGTMTITGSVQYTFIAKATNSIGDGPNSLASAPIQYGPPNAPTIDSITPSLSGAEISFLPPLDNGGSAITSYTVTSNPGNVTVSGLTSPLTMTGLTRGTSYTFTIVAINKYGQGTTSPASSSVTIPDLPNAPTITSVTTVTVNTASIEFTPPAYAGTSPITSYTVTSSPGNFTATGASSPINVTGLTAGVTYTFTIFATSSVGNSVNSAPSSNFTIQQTPNTPIIGTATSTSSTTASITFTAPTYTGTSPITSYTVVSSPGNLTATGVSSPIVISGLSSMITYSFTVYATNASGNSPNSSLSNTVGPPPVGEQSYTTPGTYSWTAPAGVTSVSVVAIGGGASGSAGFGYNGYPLNGGGGGGLAWVNNYPVTPGTSYTVRVGSGGASVANLTAGKAGQDSFFVNDTTVCGKGGQPGNGTSYTAPGGTYVVTSSTGSFGGGNGGNGGANGISFNGTGGGGAGGYAGNGGNGGTANTNIATAAGFAGSGGGGGGGAGSNSSAQGSGSGAGGGGTGILGQGTNGAGGTSLAGGGGGSGGASGGAGGGYTANAGHGADYGGGGGGAGSNSSSNIDENSGVGGGGAVRIMWGGSRSFPTSAQQVSAPSAPTGVTATLLSTTSASISFTPGSTGNLPVEYTVTSTPGNISVTGSSGPMTITGLTSGTTYTFTVTATNQMGSTVSANSNAVTAVSVDYVVVAGGGGGGIGIASWTSSAGGGGAGGMRSANGATFTKGIAYTITIGAGGAGGVASGLSGSNLTAPDNGGVSSISGSGLTTISATGGGRGGSSNAIGSGSGGSGGGGSTLATSVIAPGSGTAGQGNNGGSAEGSSTYALAGGGGGAGGPGQTANAGGSMRAGNGGDGLSNPFPVEPSILAGGGGGSGSNNPFGPSGGGGSGIGGYGYFGNYNAGSTSGSGATGTGSGGGGLHGGGGHSILTNNAGNGGSGVVILRIEASITPTTVTGSPTITSHGNHKYYRWNGNGSITF